MGKLLPLFSTLLGFSALLLHNGIPKFSADDEEHQDKDQNRHYYMTIGIMSARSNFEKRQAIRDTWAGFIRSHPKLRGRVVYKFIVSRRPCDIPPSDRLDIYSCQRWKPQPPPSEKKAEEEGERGHEAMTFESGNVPESQILPESPIGFSFKVQHPVVLTQLGLLDIFSHDVTVRLIDAATQETVVQTSFGAPGNESASIRFRSQQVRKHLLPKGFEGILIAENITSEWLDINGTSVANTANNIVKFTEVVYSNEFSVSDWREVFYGQTVPVSFTYTLHEKVILSQHIEKTGSRTKEWRDVLAREAANLTEESAKYRDLLYVDATETYRALPLKLLLFYK